MAIAMEENGKVHRFLNGECLQAREGRISAFQKSTFGNTSGPAKRAAKISASNILLVPWGVSPFSKGVFVF